MLMRREKFPWTVCATLLLLACSEGPAPTPDAGQPDPLPAPTSPAGAAPDGGAHADNPYAAPPWDARQPSPEAGTADAGAADAQVRSSDPRPMPAEAGAPLAAVPAGSCTTPHAAEGSPFGCGFAFGRDDPGGSLSAFASLQFISKWVGYEVVEGRQLSRCDGCNWLSESVAATPLVPVYYAYFIGFLGKAYGFPDGNEKPAGPNLTTDGAQVIRDHRAQLIDMYAYYARESARVWNGRPVVWLLEGDFIQYATGEKQKNKLSFAELAQLARDIACAIKGAMPSAWVGINHTTWNSDADTDAFWDALASAAVPYDLVWTTGVADNAGFLERAASASSYNARTARYAYVAKKTGRKIFVDTSFGLSAMSDSWSEASAATLNARSADGVIAAHVTGLPQAEVGQVAARAKTLTPVCSR
jgi:hypothetical protein